MRKRNKNVGIEQKDIPDMNAKSNTAGITLIALIVTIVILLILVGISIGILTGENGLIKNARKCKRTNRNSK